MKNKKAGLIIHITASALFALALLVIFILYTSLFCEFIAASFETESPDSLSQGLTRAFALIFMIIFGAADLVISLISAILSGTLAKRGEGKTRIFGKILFELSIILVALVIISFAVAVIFFN